MCFISIKATDLTMSVVTWVGHTIFQNIENSAKILQKLLTTTTTLSMQRYRETLVLQSISTMSSKPNFIAGRCPHSR